MSSEYLHGFDGRETERLYEQAATIEEHVYVLPPFEEGARIVEVGCGVGAQTAILLRRNPSIHITCIDRSKENLRDAQSHLGDLGVPESRYDLVQCDAHELPFEDARFDGVFLCWVLEHVESPKTVLKEARRVLKPKCPILITEVHNDSLYISPTPNAMMRYWNALCSRQEAIGGHPHIGVRLGQLLSAAGFTDIELIPRPLHLDGRAGSERTDFLVYWENLLLSASSELLKSEMIESALIVEMKSEFDRLRDDPNTVFFYTFFQALALA